MAGKSGKGGSSRGGGSAPERTVVDVNPRPDGKWEAKIEGRQRASSVHDTKYPAIAAAKEIAKNADRGQIRIKNREGRIQTEHTYRNDPERHKG